MHLRQPFTFDLEETAAAKEKHLDVINQKKLEKLGIIVKKTNSGFFGAAIKLFLDNMVSIKDIQQILNTSSFTKNCSYEICEFCNTKCYKSYICCHDKELQMYLLDTAMKRMYFISLYTNNFISTQTCTIKPKPSYKKTNNSNMEKLKNLDLSRSIPAFERIKKKLDNIKKFYPHVYSHSENIIELWGKDLIKMKHEVLAFDKNKVKFIWM